MNGSTPNQDSQFDPAQRYIRNGEDLAQWAHIDVLYQAYFNAMLRHADPAAIARSGYHGRWNGQPQ